jgi:hypothetical protein
MSNFSLTGHYVTKVEVKQVIGDSYGKVEIIFHSQYDDESSEKFIIDAYTLNGQQVAIEQSIDAYSLKSKIEKLEANKE